MFLKENLDKAVDEIMKNMNGRKDYVYYILGPITRFDRNLIGVLLENGVMVHVFIQGGIELAPQGAPLPPWNAGLLGLQPANAGMDVINFYDFMANDSHPNLKVYTQFTNMAKGGGAGASSVLKDLWLGEKMHEFLDELQKTESGHKFAKLWEYYNRNTQGIPWQHDPIEVINSLGELVGDITPGCSKYKQMVGSGINRRFVTFNNKTPNGRNGIIKTFQEIAPKRMMRGGGGEIVVKLMDHIPPSKSASEYVECQLYRFNQFVRLLCKSFKIQPPEWCLSADDANVDAMIETINEKIYTGISIEILDPDNNFAAELINYISGNTAKVFVHSQFYPSDVEIKAMLNKDGRPEVLGLMMVPETVIMKCVEQKLLTDPYTFKKNPTPVKLIGVPDVVNYYGVLDFVFPPRGLGGFDAKELMYSQFFGENKDHRNHLDCRKAELNFMIDLLRSKNVMYGQPCYGNNDGDRTFSSRNLVHPVTQFDLELFTDKSLFRVEFTNKVIERIANTRGSDPIRQQFLQDWKTMNSERPGIFGGRRNKSRKFIRNKSRKMKRNRSRK